MAKVILAGGPSFALFNPSLHVSLGLLYLGAALRRAGHEVKILDCHKYTFLDEATGKLIVMKELLEPCDVLGISCVTPNAEFGGQLAEAWPAKVKVAGGPHVTYILEGPHDKFNRRLARRHSESNPADGGHGSLPREGRRAQSHRDGRQSRARRDASSCPGTVPWGPSTEITKEWNLEIRSRTAQELERAASV